MHLKRSRIALGQLSPFLGDIGRNVEKHLEWCERARKEKADAIIFPELSLTGYTLRDLNFEVALDPSTASVLEPLRSISKDITIICGGVERARSGGVHNAAFVFEGGKLIHSHHKVYPPTYAIFEEERYFLAGDRARVFESERLGRIGLLVCEDLWHPSMPYLLTYQGAQLIITIAASPTKLATGNAAQDEVPANYSVNRDHHVAFARLFSVFMAFINRTGVEDGVNFWGGSEVVTPDGDVGACAKFFDEDLLIYDLDPNAVRHARENSRHVLDENLLLTKDELSRIIAEK
jgi:predicted amidohydrolase